MNLQSSTTASKIMNYIIRHKRTHDGNSPTIREMMDATGIASTSTLVYHLDRLEKAGHITRVGGRIFVTGGMWVYTRRKETA